MKKHYSLLQPWAPAPLNICLHLSPHMRHTCRSEQVIFPPKGLRKSTKTDILNQLKSFWILDFLQAGCIRYPLAARRRGQDAVESLERALNALEDDTFRAIVQHMRDAPNDPTAPRPQRKPVAQDKGFNFRLSSLQSMFATIADYMFS